MGNANPHRRRHARLGGGGLFLRHGTFVAQSARALHTKGVQAFPPSFDGTSVKNGRVSARKKLREREARRTREMAVAASPRLFPTFKRDREPVPALAVTVPSRVVSSANITAKGGQVLVREHSGATRKSLRLVDTILAWRFRRYPRIASPRLSSGSSVALSVVSCRRPTTGNR